MDRIATLEAAYHQLREDERQWGSRAVSLGSFYLVAVGTTAFFLLGNKAASENSWIGVIAPFPPIGITAVIIRQGIAATIRGRLLLAFERALTEAREEAGSVEEIELISGGLIPIDSTHHAQRPWLQGRIGSGLAWLERLALLLVPAVCFLSVRVIQQEWLLVLSATFDSVLMLRLVQLGRDAITGGFRIEKKIAKAARQVRGAPDFDDAL
jgi:hypothetical protein